MEYLKFWSCTILEDLEHSGFEQNVFFFIFNSPGSFIQCHKERKVNIWLNAKTSVLPHNPCNNEECAQL